MVVHDYRNGNIIRITPGRNCIQIHESTIEDASKPYGAILCPCGHTTPQMYGIGMHTWSYYGCAGVSQHHICLNRNMRLTFQQMCYTCVISNVNPNMNWHNTWHIWYAIPLLTCFSANASTCYVHAMLWTICYIYIYNACTHVSAMWCCRRIDVALPCMS